MSKNLLILTFTFIILQQASFSISDTCDVNTAAESCGLASELPDKQSITLTKSNPKTQEKKYLLYDVNPGEGFNLRRDVYMRVASLVKKVRKEMTSADWTLVLPPWGPLYHWKSKDIDVQAQILWSKFFDLPSLYKYVPVMEFKDFLKEHGPEIDEVYYLQHYAEGWTDGQWTERMDLRECIDRPVYEKFKDGNFYGWFWGYEGTHSKDFHCLSVQGYSSTLKPLLLHSKARAIMIDRAEVILHDTFGDTDYWMARRSMRFSKNLVKIGDEFRLKNLNSSDKADKTEQDENWMSDITSRRLAVGGPYIGVHLRRRDFVQARPSDVPNIENAAHQIIKKLKELSLTTVYVATDAPTTEFEELKQYIPGAIAYQPSKNIHKELLDGGIAIIDQWICAHSKFFIGTYESTFSFRIQEEREILGFASDVTFNRFCGNNQTSCKQPSRWTIVHP